MDGLHDLLFQMGITSNYTGYSYVVDAISICMDNPDSTSRVTKEVYPQLGRRYGVSASCVEQNIRYIVEMVWKKRPRFLELVAGKELSRRPSNKDFLTMMTVYLKRAEC